MNRKPKQNEQKPKGENRMRCMECGATNGTLHKIKLHNGKKGYLCNFCFQDFCNDE